jgi:membrane-bound lytic murein transglycosylase B
VSSKLALPIAALCSALAALVVLGACVVLLAFSVIASGAGSAQPPALPEAAAAPASTAPAGLVVPASGGPPSAFARDDIPPAYLALYRAAAARFGLDWTILAAIGRVECDHGRDPAPACTVEGRLNSAGAGGPAQFLVSTWRRYGVSATGTGVPDMWNPADAIFSMANYLRACGAPTDYPQAIYGYNHAWWYVTDVLSWAQRYRG